MGLADSKGRDEKVISNRNCCAVPGNGDSARRMSRFLLSLRQKVGERERMHQVEFQRDCKQGKIERPSESCFLDADTWGSEWRFIFPWAQVFVPQYDYARAKGHIRCALRLKPQSSPDALCSRRYALHRERTLGVAGAAGRFALTVQRILERPRFGAGLGKKIRMRVAAAPWSTGAPIAADT